MLLTQQRPQKLPWVVGTGLPSVVGTGKMPWRMLGLMPISDPKEGYVTRNEVNVKCENLFL